MNRKYRKTLSLLLVMALCFSLSSNVLADSRSTTISSSTMHRTIATSTTTETSCKDTESVATLWHQQGELSGSTFTTSKSFRASDTLTTDVHSNVFLSHITSMELSYAKTISMKIEYPIPRNYPTGYYNVYPTWTCVRLNQKVVTTYSGGSTTDYNRTISYVPCSTSKVTYYDVSLAT